MSFLLLCDLPSTEHISCMFRSSMDADVRKIATDIREIAYGGTAVASLSTLSTDEIEVRGRQRRPLAKNVADLSGVRDGTDHAFLVCLALCVSCQAPGRVKSIYSRRAGILGSSTPLLCVLSFLFCRGLE